MVVLGFAFGGQGFNAAGEVKSFTKTSNQTEQHRNKSFAVTSVQKFNGIFRFILNGKLWGCKLWHHAVHAHVEHV